ncbi:hypothetical protein ABT56_15505 [Photobacterium aquae]|uniref:Uncharacterized protein n=1 Tax=Photobacterium aquae TaxID=1195763 RepID=A0A0J1JP89_9GAMM|nr:hypothetical protein [Photobacterium aquae]KLV04032.1 hypothetical protein ABT56_15505 [Photobacterium aquae]
MLDFQPLFLGLAPLSVGTLLYALNSRKKWLARVALVGMLVSMLIIMVFQYLDYKHLEDCLLKGEVYTPLSQHCIKLRE